ncbi:DUF6387 family protein [Pasteurella multocida]|uniref:DUF6387 family protein n=2 Tax=Pasteurella multocida TaxID=747 RepID=UPI000DFB425E|nr:DUF6387 family protein [Pasteurella multocida]MCL7816665.1 DUF6387 family protein [Pasteurella multocida]MDY0640635.1 DUF6387 family protein [Pasteurella multocida]SUB43303.1 Uncharacterised protein [Pasteurella multocida subsp. septica]HDR1026855.1 hypothetical protein [Pasteurella multocida]
MANIPNWFKLENYDNLINFNRSQWTIAIFNRKMVYDDLKAGRYKNNPEKEAVEFEKYFISKLMQEMMNTKFKFEEVGDTCVRRTDLFDLLIDYEKVHLDKRDLFISSLDEIRREFIENKEEFNEDYTPTHYLELEGRNGFNEYIDEEGELSIKIDLAYSDNYILEQVKQLLANTREKQKHIDYTNGKVISDSEIDSLIKYKVLPYIDLLLWSELTGEKYKNYELADILFSDDYEGSSLDTFRNVTRKKALKLLSMRRPKFY